jgi:hypothetical protein
MGLLELELGRLGSHRSGSTKRAVNISTGKRPKLKRISIDQVRFRALHQHIQVVEVPNDHPHPMQSASAF